MTFSYDASAPSADRNPLWQAVNKALGGPIDLAYTPVADYTQRFATATAGGELPDLVAIKTPIPQLPGLLRATFTDLSDLLSGDAVLEYPNLASLPTDSWRATMVDNSLWGVPIPRPPIAATMFIRRDLVTQSFGSQTPSNLDEVTEMMTALTDPRRSRWAMTDPMTMLDYVALSFGLGAAWSEQGGKFTNVHEQPQYADALDDVRTLVQQGVFHPDGLTANNNQRNGWFTAGVVAMVHTGFTGWPKFTAWGKDVPGFELGALLPVPHEAGGKAAASRGGPISHFTAIPRGDQARVKQLLEVLDWMSAPFGTAEYLTKAYGEEGVTYTRRGGDVEWTDEGNAMRTVPFLYVGDNVQVIYQPQSRTRPAQFEYQEEAVKLLQPDPTLGLYSETNAARAAKLSGDLQQAKTDIVVGRRPVSAWADAVAAWRSGGGDQIRAEYEQAMQQQATG